MNEIIEELKKGLLASFAYKQSDWRKKVYNSQEYQQELKYISDVSKDFIETIRSISFYSTRAGDIYESFLSIKASDDLLQSAIAIEALANNGVHNTVKRELRYLIEMITKYVIADFDNMGQKLEIKLKYLHENIPNSSIEIIENYQTPFQLQLATIFKNEVKDFFYKSCAYVHPSKKQFDEQMSNYSSGNSIGFESAKMFADLNKIIFRAYDMILTMCLHGFGPSMSKDLFEQVFNENTKWKFHKGKYIKEFKYTLFH